MKRITSVVAVIVALTATGLAFNGDGGRRFREVLSGFKEAAAPISTTGNGTFEATISKDETEINYVLTFENLEGDVRQAHIHIGYPQNSGGIVLWLCDSVANPSPSATTPDCTDNNPNDLRSGRVTGTLTAADVQVQTANGIAGPAEWAELLGLVRAGRTYANVHSTKFPSGEIRSQLDNGDDDNDDHGHHDH
jgi:hypothetical protein